jgi:hypothetical protein
MALCRPFKNRPFPTTAWEAVFLSILLLITVVGCGIKVENVTANLTGRRVGQCDADGEYLAYIWHPAQLISTQGHLVLLDRVAGTETELESDLSGPWAMCEGRVVWWNARLRDDKGKSDVIVYDVRSGEKEAIAHVKVQDLEADGTSVIWKEPSGTGDDVVLYNTEIEERKVISSPAAEGETIYHNNLQFDDGTAAWEACNATTRKTGIELYRVETGELSRVDIPGEHAPMSVSGNRLVYCPKKGEVHLYDIAAGTDQLIQTVERLAGPPSIEADKIAWCEHVTKERFKEIPGQPLFNEKDVCDVFLFDINSQEKKMLAEYLLSNGHVALHEGRVYLSALRENPPPGESNMVVPVDLLVW